MKTLHRLELLFATLSLLSAVLFLIGVLSKLDGTVILGSSEGRMIEAIVYLTIALIILLCSYLHVLRSRNIAGAVIICLGGLFFLFEAHGLLVMVLLGYPIKLITVFIFMITLFIGLTAGLALASVLLKPTQGLAKTHF